MDIIYLAINKAISCNATFYAYRMPNESCAVFSASREGETGNGKGFAIVPFTDSYANAPKVIIPQGTDAETFLDADTILYSYPSTHRTPAQSTTMFSEYSSEFKACMHLLSAGELSKVVLSRITKCSFEEIDWGRFFINMSETYPSAFVFIFNSPATGFWAGASPETLARYHDRELQTMALAGTKIASDKSDWGQKEIVEQRLVADFIESVFASSGAAFKKSPLYSQPAGKVKHLCNNYSARIEEPSVAERILKHLHPTPALCGIPQDAAKEAISKIELHDRLYYGGYVGPYSPTGFDYFVNLRSLQFDNESQILYTGGGLTTDSVLESEWRETEIKTDTMMSILSRSGKI